MPHSTDNAAYAARLITDGPFGANFWLGTISLGGIMPLGLFGLEFHVERYVSAVLSLAGVLVFEWCFVWRDRAFRTAEVGVAKRFRMNSISKRDGSHLVSCAPVEKWDDWVELDPQSWPKRVEKHYQLVPTICFNCESACGLLAYVNKATGEDRQVRRQSQYIPLAAAGFAKGPATINQIHDPDRILYPMKRAGSAEQASGREPRGPKFWKSSAAAFARRSSKRGEEVMYHVGRPGHDFIMDRTLQAWGIDGHNSHTNVCSSSARLGYLLWHYADRPSPDHANARFILLLSAHLESGHYFNPHAQRIIEGKMAGAKLAVMDPRLSNTASMADYWMPTYPGTESAVLLAMAKVILDENRFDAAFVKNWTNWQQLDIDGFTCHRDRVLKSESKR